MSCDSFGKSGVYELVLIFKLASKFSSVSRLRNLFLIKFMLEKSCSQENVDPKMVKIPKANGFISLKDAGRLSQAL